MTQLSEEIPLHILIVEDSLTSQLVIKELLEQLGYVPDIASNGKEAIEAMYSKKYDLIFMDEHMPIMDGLEATSEIRKNFGNQTIIVALTGSDLEEDKKKYLAIGMNDSITKPLSVSCVKNIIYKFGKIDKNTSKENISCLNSCEKNIMAAFNENKRIALLFITSFLKDIDHQISEIETSIRTKNYSLLHETAHKLKGSASYCGNETLNAILKDLCSTTDIDNAISLFLKLKTMIYDLKEELTSFKKNLDSNV